MSAMDHLTHASINLATANANGIVLQSYAPDAIETGYSKWNESTTLITDMREKINMDIWDIKDGSNDGAMDEHLRLFADQIDSNANEITSNASMLLEEFELYSSSPTTSVSRNLDDVVMLGDYSYLNEPNQNALFNLSLTDGKSWLEDIEHEVSIIESWEVEAEKLAHIAVAAFQNLKSNTTNAMEATTLEAMSVLETNASEIYNAIQMIQGEMKQLQKQKYIQSSSSDPILLHEETWKSGGFSIEDTIPSGIALETIKSMPLSTYKLRDDTKRDVGVDRNERRTRYHVGVIDPVDGDKRMEHSSIFSYNIGAVSQLATLTDRLLSKVTASVSFFRQQPSLKDKVSEMIALTSDLEMPTDLKSFKSPSQLASEVAALETEATLTRIARLSQTVVQSTRVNLIHSRLISGLKSSLLKSQSLERVGMVERDSMSTRENHATDSEAYLDQLLIHLETMDKMKTIWNSTRRELFQMNEAANIESHVAKEEIHAEAEVERENEATSLEMLALIGKARMEEILHAIENIFWHLAGCLQHIVTPEGRQQFLFYVGTAAGLVFVASTMREMISLCCICILRFFTAPRLVREYGNLNLLWPSKSTHAMDKIILPHQIKERMDIIVKVASAASKRRFPLRSVLIHGKPGSGKSMLAKSIAQSIPGLPYTLISGADVFPMGSQGPAELRRLLTWASNKRQGGIIIIDEAESALGSRAKTRRENDGPGKTLEHESTSSSSGYSRDCLNVLLSMTGNFGNIMLILTTANPGELDEAVLDRMDEIVEFELPGERERRKMITGHIEKCLLKPPGRRAKKMTAVDIGDEEIERVVKETEGFSGRAIAKLSIAWQAEAFGTDGAILDQESFFRTVQNHKKSFAQKHIWSKK
ncbi:hypothetical protein ACHAXR_009402 [Thalassiosira sp. AJA248-18]